MAWFKKKEELSSLDKINDVIEQVKIIAKEDPLVSIMVIGGTMKEGSSLVRGSIKDLHFMLINTAEEERIIVGANYFLTGKSGDQIQLTKLDIQWP